MDKQHNAKEAIVVMVVEDEMMLRMAAVDAMDDAGFFVIEAVNADAAVRILQARAGSVDALFTDVNMPGPMNGLMLARHARRLWPWIGVLVASGDVKPGTADMPDDSRFFSKPYDLNSVVRRIRETARAA
jgi:CheY-like chemotaxis protein